MRTMAIATPTHSRYEQGTDTRAASGYRVCRGHGGPLGAVWAAIR